MFEKQRKGLRNLLIPALLLGSCGVQNSTTTLKDHAQTGAERAKIVKVIRNVLTGGNEMETVFGLVSGQGDAARIYYFDCQASDGSYDIAAVQAFATAIGYAGDIRDLTAIDAEDGTPTGDQIAQWHGLGAGEQPALKCRYPAIDEAYLHKVTYPDNSDKYFLTVGDRISPRNKRILYHLGCDRLARSMGLDPATASPLPYALMLQDYDGSDAYDIHCISGSPVGQGVVWEQGQDAVIDVTPGTALSAVTFTARNPNQNYAPLTYTIEPTPADAACNWITPINAGPSYIFFGNVPATFTNRSCKITVTAAAGQVQQDKKTVVIRNRLRPVLQSNCPAQSTLLAVGDFPNCTVTADVGEVQITSQSCPHSFIYDIKTSRLILTLPPVVDGTCDVSLVGRNDDLVSEPLSIRVKRVCDVGYTNTGGVCKKVACDSTHVYGDHWQTAIEGGQSSYSCNASGQAVFEGVACTVVGYEPVGSACQKVKCDTTHTYGQEWPLNITNGTQTIRCEADKSTHVARVSCNSGYTPTADFQCTPVYCGFYAGRARYYLDFWYEYPPHGSQWKSCGADKNVVSQPVKCDSGYENSGGNCIPASCNGHASGTSWNVTISHGTRSYSCSYGIATPGAISCSAGYYNLNGTCTLEVETDPPICKKKPDLPQCK